MENFDQPLDLGMQQNNAENSKVTPELLGYLQGTSTWTKVMSIFMFILLGLMALGMLFGVTVIASQGVGPGLAIMVIGVIYIALLLMPALYLWRFSENVTSAIRDNNNEALGSAFKNMMRYYRYIGYFTIIFFAIYILAIIVGASAASFMGMQ